MQEIQFLEFMGGSNLRQAFPTYLICLRFIRISTALISPGVSMEMQLLRVTECFCCFLW